MLHSESTPALELSFVIRPSQLRTSSSDRPVAVYEYELKGGSRGM